MANPTGDEVEAGRRVPASVRPLDGVTPHPHGGGMALAHSRTAPDPPRPGDLVSVSPPHPPAELDEGFVATVSEEGLVLIAEMHGQEAQWVPAAYCTVVKPGPFHIIAKSVTINMTPDVAA